MNAQARITAALQDIDYRLANIAISLARPDVTPELQCEFLAVQRVLESVRKTLS